MRGNEKSRGRSGLPAIWRCAIPTTAAVLGLAIALPLSGSCFFLLQAGAQVPASGPVRSIHWDDGDSGEVDGKPFRLANIDAPETGGVGAAIGGAKCEAEREEGKAAKAFVERLTANAVVIVTREYGYETRDRAVVDLSVDGNDIAKIGLAAGVYKSWKHEKRRAIEPRPSWC